MREGWPHGPGFGKVMMLGYALRESFQLRGLCLADEAEDGEEEGLPQRTRDCCRSCATTLGAHPRTSSAVR